MIKLLLRTSIDVNSADADGNTALHWSAKTSKGSCPRQMESVPTSLSLFLDVCIHILGKTQKFEL